jgi:predicted N-acetyltransferase YhbS
VEFKLRPVEASDIEECGRIIYEAFKGIAEKHNFRPDFPSAESGVQFAQMLTGSPTIFGVVAESGGRVVGSNFLWEHDPIRAVGPITVDPKFQGYKIGRRLMEAVIERGGGASGVRLVQDAFNAASLSLYASLGFDVREPLVEIEGQVEGELPAGCEVRLLKDEDLDECEALCKRVHGFARTNELKATRQSFAPFVTVRDGHIVAYATALNFWPLNHAVSESLNDMQALLTGAGNMSGQPLSFLLPTRQGELFRWCLSKGMRVVKPLALMTTGEYQEPRGIYLPSVGY